MAQFDDGSDQAPRRSATEYLEIPLRRWRLVLLPFVVIVTAALVASQLLPKKYRSSTFILVESEKVPEYVLPRTVAERAERRLQSIRQEILSRARLERVIRETDPYPGSVGKVPMSDLIDRIKGATEIAVRGNDAFSIEYVHADPRKAADVVNRLASLFIEESTLARGQQVEDASTFIGAQLEEARRNLEMKEEAVRRYKETRMGTLPEQSAANISSLQGLQMQQQALGDDLRAALDRQGALEKQLADVRRGVAAGTGVGDPLAEISRLKNQLASLRTRYTDEHPDVQEAMRRLALLEKSLSTPSQAGVAGDDSAVATAQVQLDQSRREAAVLQQKRDELGQRIAALQGRIDMAPRTEQELSTLTRDFTNLREHYLTLLNKQLDAQMAAKLEQRWKGDQFRIVDSAYVPDRPFFPNTMVFLAAGIILGLVAGIGTAVMAEVLDHSFSSLPDVEAALPYPVLAVIPYLPSPGAHPSRRPGGQDLGSPSLP
jgi:polysaccharide biosynthesis transport protein